VVSPSLLARVESASQEAWERASAYFGPQDEGLEIKSKDECCWYSEGGGGYVAIMVQPGEQTTLGPETRQWDRAVREFKKQVH
jgi:hypothetical protein